MDDDDNSPQASKIHGKTVFGGDFEFCHLCHYLDRIRKLPKNGTFAKKRVFGKLMAEWKVNQTEKGNSGVCTSFFPVLSLMLGTYDGRRFNMKTRKLITKVCKSLLLPDDFKKDLLSLEAKSPTAAVNRLAEEIVDRNPSAKGHLTLLEINSSLDRVIDADLSEAELESLLRNCSTTSEIFWLMNILTRNVERSLGLPASTILNWIHPRGNELHQSGISIQKICDSAAVGVYDDLDSLLFKPFKPMLLAKIKHGNDVYDKLSRYCGHPFYVELKYDGEHFLIHRNDANEFRYFSRNQNDFSNKIGALMNNRLSEFFSSDVKNCILDGELLLWDVKAEKYVGKGREASDGRVYDVKSLPHDCCVVACLVIFDVLYANNQSYMNVPLQERINKLRDGSIIQKQNPSTICVSSPHIIYNRADFIAFYENAMKNNEEGVVAKKMNSLYKIGVRHMANGWFKIKPYHLGEETLDTAIVGVERNRRGLIENFAMAVLKDEKLFVIGKVTYGMDVATRSRLKENLVRDRGWLNSSSLPEWIHEESTQLSNITDYVAKENIQIVEVKASGVMNGILQFPVMKFLRDDKGVDEVDKYEDFVDFDKNLRTGSLINVGRSNETSSKKVNAAEVMEPYRVMGDNPVDEVGVELRGWQICVLRGNVDTSVQKLREIIHAFGGTPTANPGPSTKLVISGESNHLKTRSVVHSKKYNVVKADWLVKCEEQKQVIPITDEYVIYSCDSEIFNYFKPRSDDFLSMED